MKSSFENYFLNLLMLSLFGMVWKQKSKTEQICCWSNNKNNLIIGAAWLVELKLKFLFAREIVLKDQLIKVFSHLQNLPQCYTLCCTADNIYSFCRANNVANSTSSWNHSQIQVMTQK